MAVTSIYGRNSENVSPNATWTLDSGGADSTYPIANIKDQDPTTPAGSTSTAMTAKADFGSAQRVDLVMLWNHNLRNNSATLVARYQANAADSWGAPTVNVLLSIPAPDKDNFIDAVFLDVTGQAGYSASGFRYHRLLITGNDANVKIGEVLFYSTKRTLSRPFSWGIPEQKTRRVVVLRTNANVRLNDDRGYKWREWPIKLWADAASRRDLVYLWEDARMGARPVLLALDPTNSAAILDSGAVNSGALLCYLKEPAFVRNINNPNFHPTAFTVEEAGRGLSWY